MQPMQNGLGLDSQCDGRNANQQQPVTALTLDIAEELVERIAERAAELVAERSRWAQLDRESGLLPKPLPAVTLTSRSSMAMRFSSRSTQRTRLDRRLSSSSAPPRWMACGRWRRRRTGRSSRTSISATCNEASAGPLRTSTWRTTARRRSARPRRAQAR